MLVMLSVSLTVGKELLVRGGEHKTHDCHLAIPHPYALMTHGFHHCDWCRISVSATCFTLQAEKTLIFVR